MDTRPFDSPYRDVVLVKDVIFERIMPLLSPQGWKVLCAVIHQTWGGKQGQPVGHSQLARQTGIGDPSDLEQAIQECVDARFLVLHQMGQKEASDKVWYAYTLNTAFEFEMEELADALPKAGGKELPPLTADQEDSLQALLAFGEEIDVRPDHTQLREAVSRNDADSVLAWIETGRVMTHLEPSMRFQTVVERLLAQVPPLPLGVEAEDLFSRLPEPDSAGLTADALWEAVLEELQSQTKRSMFKWLKPTRAVDLVDNTLTVAAPNKRTKEWLEQGQLTETIQETLEKVAGVPIELVAVVGE